MQHLLRLTPIWNYLVWAIVARPKHMMRKEQKLSANYLQHNLFLFFAKNFHSMLHFLVLLWISKHKRKVLQFWLLHISMHKLVHDKCPTLHTKWSETTVVSSIHVADWRTSDRYWTLTFIRYIPNSLAKGAKTCNVSIAMYFCTYISS